MECGQWLKGVKARIGESLVRLNILKQGNIHITFFCEGERTEPLYFGGFRKAIDESTVYRNMVSVQIIPCGMETLRVVDAAEKYIAENGITRGMVWCIYDKDDFPDRNFNAAAERIKILNSNSSEIEYHAGWSNECIELWFVLHFAYYDVANHRDEYVKFLNERLKILGRRYTKDMADIFKVLEELGEPKQAIRRAMKLMAGKEGLPPSKQLPATRVYELVQELAKYLPETSKVKYI